MEQSTRPKVMLGEVVLGCSSQLRLLVWKQKKIITVKSLCQKLCADPWSSFWGNAWLILKCKQSKLFSGDGEKAWTEARLRWVSTHAQLLWFQDSGVHISPSKLEAASRVPTQAAAGPGQELPMSWPSWDADPFTSLLVITAYFFLCHCQIPALIFCAPRRQNTGNWIYLVLEFVRFRYKINK